MVIEKVQNWMLHLSALNFPPAKGDKEWADSVTDGEVDNTHPGWNIIETLRHQNHPYIETLKPTHAETLKVSIISSIQFETHPGWNIEISKPSPPITIKTHTG